MGDHPPPPDATELADELRDAALDRPAGGSGGSSDDDEQPDDTRSTGNLGDDQ